MVIFAAGKFKQHCLRLMDDNGAADGFGFLAGTITIHGDSVAPDSDEWGDDA
jgi:hypothetical protein